MRSIMFFGAVTAAALTLAGCATGPSLQSRMATYTGASGETLIKDLGVPDKQVTLKDAQYLAYVRQQTALSPDIPLFFGYSGLAPSRGFGGFGGYYGPFPGPYSRADYGGDFAPSERVFRCETTFKLQDDKVVSFSLSGNDCS